MTNSNQSSGDVSASKTTFAVLFSLVFLDNLGFAIVVPYLYFYVVALGGSALVYGVLLASYSLMSFVFTPIVARLSDRYGRRRILLFALAISSLAYLIFGLAQTIWVLFIGRMLSGTTAATVPVAQAYVADATTRNQRLRYLGLLGATAGLAFIFGPAIGGTLSALYGYGVPSFLASVLALANLVSAFFLLPEPDNFTKQTALSFQALLSVLRKRKIILLLAIYSLFLAIIMFLVALNIKPKEFIGSIKGYKIILLALGLVFIVPTMISIVGIPFFSPTEYAALVIALSAPSAVSAVFWSDVFHGYTPLALIISMVTNLLALITIPLTIFLLTQSNVQIDATGIFVNLLLIVVVPLIAGQALRTLSRQKTQKIVVLSPLIQHGLLLFLVWGAVAPGAAFTRENPLDFLLPLVFILLILSATFAIAYFVGKRYGRSKAIALALVSSQKNATLAIVIGELVLGPMAVPALIANLVGQNIFLFPARMALHFMATGESSKTT